MIQRRTQTATYWQEQFDFSGKDVGYIYDLILEKGEPVSTARLVKALIEQHCRKEEESMRAELSAGRVYQPQDTYQQGDRLIFPALDFALGTVLDTRSGRSPDYGDFTVIQVQMDRGNGTREFASQLDGEHILNRADGDADLLTTGDLLGVDELYGAYGSHVEEKLLRTLREHHEFVVYNGEWFLRDLLAPINAGHLNIAEALIEVLGMPVPTTKFLSDLDLPSEISEQVQLLSVNHALHVDERFDNVGDSGRDIWYLRRLAPEPVVNPPARLALPSEPYDRHRISSELLAIERVIDDEGSGEEVLGPARQIYRTTLALTYPHWRCGTLPLTVRSRGLFPQATTHHTPVILVDGQSGDKMQGWIVHQAAFVYGLEGWYKRYRVPVGAFIRLERTRDPRVVTVDFQPQRLQHLWVKFAAAEGGRLVFQMRKLPIACEHDDLLTIGEADAPALDQLWDEVQASGESLFQVMIRVVPELVRLSPQGTVHAKTIYSAVNVLKRMPPGPIFALMSTEPCFVSMGGGYWTFDETLVKLGAK